MDLLGRMAEFGIIGFIAHYALQSIIQTQSGDGEWDEEGEWWDGEVEWEGEWEGEWWDGEGDSEEWEGEDWEAELLDPNFHGGRIVNDNGEWVFLPWYMSLDDGYSSS